LLARWARVASKGDRIRAERALAEAEQRARADAEDLEVVGKPDKRQKEDGDDPNLQRKKKAKDESE
jgi:hypothetical protein